MNYYITADTENGSWYVSPGTTLKGTKLVASQKFKGAEKIQIGLADANGNIKPIATKTNKRWR